MIKLHSFYSKIEYITIIFINFLLFHAIVTYDKIIEFLEELQGQTRNENKKIQYKYSKRK